MKMQTSVSRDGIVANKGEILGKVRFAVASYNVADGEVGQTVKWVTPAR